MLNIEFPEIYIIRGGQSQIPTTLPQDNIVILSESQLQQINLSELLSVGNAPYTFELMPFAIRSVIGKSMLSDAKLDSNNGMLNLTLSEIQQSDSETRSIFELPISVTDARYNTGEATLTVNIPPILKWRDGMDPNLLDEFLVNYEAVDAINLELYYEKSTLDYLHFKGDTVTDYGGRIVADNRPLNDIRNFTENEPTDVVQDENTGNYGNRNTTLKFSMPTSFASMRSKVVVTDNLGRSIEGWFQFYSRMEWPALPKSFGFYAYTISRIDLNSHLASGREDDEIIYTLTRDDENVFDFIYEGDDAHNGILRFKGIQEDLEETLTINLKAQDRAYDNRYTELELTIGIDTPSNEQKVVRADVVVLGSSASPDKLLAPTTVFDAITEVFDPPPVRTILPEIDEPAEKLTGSSYPFVFNIHDYIQGGSPPYEFYILEIDEETDSYRSISNTDPTIQIDVDTGIITYSPIGNYLDNRIKIVLEVVDQNHTPSEDATNLVGAYLAEGEAPPSLRIGDITENGEQAVIEIIIDDNVIVIGRPIEEIAFWQNQPTSNTCAMAVVTSILRSLGIRPEDFDPNAPSVINFGVNYDPDNPIGEDTADGLVTIEDIIYLGVEGGIFKLGGDGERGGTQPASLPRLFDMFGVKSDVDQILTAGHFIQMLDAGTKIMFNVDSVELWENNRTASSLLNEVDEAGYGISPVVAEAFSKITELEWRRLRVLGITPHTATDLTLEDYENLGVPQLQAYKDVLDIDALELLTDDDIDAFYDARTKADHLVWSTGIIGVDGEFYVVLNDPGKAGEGGGSVYPLEEFLEAAADSSLRIITADTEENWFGRITN